MEVGRCLSYLHDRGLVHEHLTPSNIFIDRNEAALVSPMRTVKHNATILSRLRDWNSLAYKSPEECAECEQTLQSNQYSLALIGYELLSGSRIFSTFAIHQPAFQKCSLNTKLNSFNIMANKIDELYNKELFNEPEKDDLVEVLKKMAAKRIEDRYEDSRAFVAALASTRPGNESAEQFEAGVLQQSFARLRASSIPKYGEFLDRLRAASLPKQGEFDNVAVTRCPDAFYRDFYHELVEKVSDEQKKNFKKTDLLKQRRILDFAMVMLFSQKDDADPNAVAALARMHGENLKVSKNDFEMFERVFLNTVRAHDPLCQEEGGEHIVTLWKKAMRRMIGRMLKVNKKKK